MKLITPRLRIQAASSMINLDTYTNRGKLLFAKADADKAYVGRVYRASPLIGGGSEFSNVVRNVFKAVPDDSVIQVSLVCTPDHDAPARFARGKDRGSATVSELVARQRGVLAGALEVGWTDDVPLLNRRHVLISLAVPSTKPATQLDDETLDGTLQLQTEFEGNLKSCGFWDMTCLTAAEVVAQYRLFACMFSPVSAVQLDELVDLKRQVYGPDQMLDFRDRRVGVLGGPGNHSYCAAVTCKAFPEQVFHGLMNLVSGAPLNQGPVREGGGQRISTPFILSTTIRVAHQRREAERVARAIESRRGSQKFPIKLGAEDPAAKLGDLQRLAKQCAENENKFVYVSTTGFVFGRNPEDAVQAASAFKGTLDKLEFDSRDVLNNVSVRWAQMLPMNYSPKLADKLGGEGVMSAAAASCLLPVYGDYLGNVAENAAQTGAAFITRRGAMHCFDMFATESNPNGIIAAMPGAGKSVTLQYVVETELAQGTRVIVLDNGGSAKKFCHAVGGEYNEFGNKSGFRPSLNPFSGLTDDEFDEQQETITSLLLLMAYEGTLPESGARIAMGEAVKAAYGQKSGKTDIHTVILALEQIRSASQEYKTKTEVEVAASNLVPRLKAFVESPTRGQYFRGQGTLDAKSALTVFELGTLGDDKHLKKCVLFFIMNVLISRVKGLKGRKLIIVDECHDLLEDPTADRAMEGLYLKCRKDAAAVWVVVQSLLKLAETAAGPVMLRQSPWKLILKQTSEEIDKIFEHKVISGFAADPYFQRVIRSVETRKGQFSEVLILGPNSYEVGRLYLDRFSATLLSSEGPAREAVFALMEGGMSAADAVNQVLGDTKTKRMRWIQDFVQELRDAQGLSAAEIMNEVRETLQ